MTIRCQKCGASFAEDISFCGSCGSRLGRTQSWGDSDDDPGPDPLIGTIIDARYRILSKLGEGGMGAVYKIEHVHMGKYMAMKLLLREFSGNRDIVRRFKREAQAVSRLSHMNTVQVFDFGRTAEGAMYMVMEFIQGENLATVLFRDGPMTESRTASIVAQICASLSEAHAAGVVHRDLKPENIMMMRTKDSQGFVKVLDFGLAKLREREEGTTSHGSLVGTPYYMSPEQIRGGDVDHRSDIYSLGAMMFKMLTGEAPFRAPSPIAVLTKHLQEPVPAMRKVRRDIQVSATMEGVIRKAMSKDPDSRYGSVDDLREAVERTVKSPSGNAPSDFVAFDDEPEWSRATDLKLGSRRDFDRFEQRMRRRSFLRWAVLFVLLSGGGAVTAWGYFYGGWFARTEESEPNNSRGRANEITPGKRIKGFIGKRLSDHMGDIDWYRLRSPGRRNSVLRAEVSGVPNMDIMVEVFEGRKAKRSSWLANNSGVGGPEVIPNFLLRGPIYLLVREVPGTKAGPTENVSDPYYLVAKLELARRNRELEPNDNLFTATDAQVGKTILGLAGKLKDRDYFRFPRSGEKGERYDIELTGVPGVGLSVSAIAGGFRLPDKLPGRVTLPAGDKHLFVVVEATTGCNTEQPYRLRVKKMR